MSNPYPLNEYGQPIQPGYNPYGYHNNPFNDPYGPPPPPPPANIYPQPPPSAGVMIIQHNYSDQLPCPYCGCQTQTIPFKRPGGVTYLWCCCLLMFTGVLCCIPFCVDSCQDTHLVCVRCNNSKQVIPANCC